MSLPTDQDLASFIARIPAQQTQSLPIEAAVGPLPHYERTVNDAWNLLVFVERKLAVTQTDRAFGDPHMSRLHSMVMLSLLAAFERLIKELAAACVDHVGRLVLDDRLDVFKIDGSTLAAHFSTDTLGRALCESETWMDCDKTNEKFKKLLARPSGQGGAFWLLPAERNSRGDGWRHETVSLLWQLRHDLAHNVGVITQSDAHTLTLLAKAPIPAPRVLKPRKADVWYVKMFLDSTAKLLNRRVADQLALVLTELHQSNSALFNPSARAQELANQFRHQLTVSGATAVPAQP